MFNIYYSREELLSDEEKRAIDITLDILLELEQIQGPGELSISLVSAEEIAALNRDYRGIDKETDVLSFPQYGSKDQLMEEAYKVLGDIVLNMDKVRSQAQEYGHGLMRELVYLTIHSFYHLMGFDHEEELDKVQMREKEEKAYRLVEEGL